VDRDLESQQQQLLLTGTIAFHYFGERFAGNA
jgi:hypothetical protein